MDLPKFIVYRGTSIVVPFSSTHANINSDYVTIGDHYEDWGDQKMKIICPFIKEWKVSRLFLSLCSFI